MLVRKTHSKSFQSLIAFLSRLLHPNSLTLFPASPRLLYLLFSFLNCWLGCCYRRSVCRLHTQPPSSHSLAANQALQKGINKIFESKTVLRQQRRKFNFPASLVNLNRPTDHILIKQPTNRRNRGYIEELTLPISLRRSVHFKFMASFPVLKTTLLKYLNSKEKK